VDIAQYLEAFDAPVLAHAMTAQQLGDVVGNGEKIPHGRARDRDPAHARSHIGCW
jgi:hypothetical protein